MSDIHQKIQEQINDAGLVVYMKGTPLMPMCGFSAQVVKIMEAVGAEFTHYNVLEDQELREGIKSFTNWPTIPQVYFNGEFIGGCDIVTEMYRNGELQTMLKN